MISIKRLAAAAAAAVLVMVISTISISAYNGGNIPFLSDMTEQDIPDYNSDEPRTVILNSKTGAVGDDIKTALSNMKETGGTVKLIGDFTIDHTVNIYTDQTIDASEAVITGDTSILVNAYQVENISIKGGKWILSGKSEVAKVSGCDNCRFDALDIEGGGMFGFGSLFFSCTEDVSVTNCKLKNIDSEAVYAYKSTNVLIQDCDITRSVGHGIRLYSTEDFRVAGNNINGACGDGISCSNCKDGEISGNKFDGITKNPDLDIDLHRNTSRSGCGILISESKNISIGNQIQCGDKSYEGNKVHNTENYGIHINASYDTFIYNTSFIDIGTDGVHNSASADTVVRDCLFNNCMGSGISFIPGPLSSIDEILQWCSDSLIDNNNIDQCGSFGIFLSKTKSTDIKDNNITNCTDFGLYVNVCEDIHIYDGKIQNTKAIGDSGIRVNNSKNVIADVDLKLEKNSLVLGKGEKYNMQTENNAAEWSTSDQNVAVAYGGEITAIGLGTANITAKTKSNKTAECKVIVQNEPDRISLNWKSLQLGVGEKQKLICTLPTGTASALKAFRTSNSQIIKMSETDGVGKFEAVGEGVAWVTVRLYNGLEQNCKITVKKPPASVSFKKSSVRLGVGEKYKLSAVFADDETSFERVYSSSNEKVVRITGENRKGEITAVGTGTATVTMRTFNGIETSCKVTVVNAPYMLSLSDTEVTLGVGESYSVSAVIPDDCAAAERVFRSSNSDIVKMTKTSGTGEFTAASPGTAYVSVKLYNGMQSSCKVTVRKPPEWVKMNKPEIEMKVGETASLTALIPEGSASKSAVFRSSSNAVEMICTEGRGQFKALKKGTAVITVRLYNGKEASCKVTIK